MTVTANPPHEVRKMTDQQSTIVMEDVTDPEELAKARAQDERFARNSAWLQGHIPEVYSSYRGKCVVIAGQELFAADTPGEAWALAAAAHPEDDGCFIRYIPREKVPGSMRIDGEWLLFDDGIARPVIRGVILTSDGSWQAAEFLVDTGADRTVFSASTLSKLGLPSAISQERIGGLGGLADSVVVESQIRLTRETARPTVFRSHFAAVTEVDALDINVLGRDITGLFSVIIDQPGDVVCLLGSATITPSSRLEESCLS